MERTLKERVWSDLGKKIVFLVGPRQVGKTWLAKSLMAGRPNSVYLSWDRLGDRRIIRSEGWLKSTELLVLDELHKSPGWKAYLKGLFDTRDERLKILVTGSARLDFARQAGSSIAGRFIVHHLFPVTPAELRSIGEDVDIDRLFARGGFPEPYLAEEGRDADRWRALVLDGLLREDVPDLARIHDLRAMQHLVEMLRARVGAPVSYESLARDLEVAPNTVKRYIEILEALYVVFRVTPFAERISRSLRKNPKLYFFDSGLVVGEAGARFENFVAVCLLGHLRSLSDQDGKERRLCFVRTKEGREVDFCLVREGCPELLVEAKTSEADLHRPLLTYSRALGVPGVQLVKELRREEQWDHLTLRAPETFLAELSA